MEKGRTCSRRGCRSISSLIIIFGWLDAQLPHLMKYSQGYTHLYPQATQLIIRSNIASVFKPQRSRFANLAPALEAVEALGVLDPRQSPPRVLSHVFSNGGGMNLVTLSDLLVSRQSVPARSALVLDSCPGRPSIRGSTTAITMFIRSRWLRWPAMVFAALTLAALHCLSLFGVWQDPILYARRALFRPRLLPWMWTGDDIAAAPRLYIFSRGDVTVAADAVLAHVERAKEAGLNVSIEEFEGSAHVSHMRTDPVRYWKLISELWASAK
ncbi:hypothetical protein BC834DRAFT_830670 [Gloeopeniophorella convolvens]|nr:hypothetical protein BC834DRAFT_830670 [Gloeopeniophorella convolvens]